MRKELYERIDKEVVSQLEKASSGPQNDWILKIISSVGEVSKALNDILASQDQKEITSIDNLRFKPSLIKTAAFAIIALTDLERR